MDHSPGKIITTLWLTCAIGFTLLTIGAFNNNINLVIVGGILVPSPCLAVLIFLIIMFIRALCYSLGYAIFVFYMLMSVRCEECICELRDQYYYTKDLLIRPVKIQSVTPFKSQ